MTSRHQNLQQFKYSGFKTLEYCWQSAHLRSQLGSAQPTTPPCNAYLEVMSLPSHLWQTPRVPDALSSAHTNVLTHLSNEIVRTYFNKRLRLSSESNHHSHMHILMKACS